MRILLNTNHPMFIWWGPELIQFYNDAYRQTMGPERHPSALGQRGRECWAEIWDIIGPQIEQVMSGGGATWHENQLVPVTRHGRLEQVYWTYGYSPIDEDDGIGGVLVVCRDVTAEYLASVALREREAELARVQQLGRIGGLEVDLRTGFRNRRSPEYLLIHGLPPDATNETHEDWVGRIHPEDREATEKKFRDAVAGDVREYSAQYRIIRPSDGETVDFGQIDHRARPQWRARPPGRRAHRCHRAGDGGAGAAAKRRGIPHPGGSCSSSHLDRPAGWMAELVQPAGLRICRLRSRANSTATDGAGSFTPMMRPARSRHGPGPSVAANPMRSNFACAGSDGAFRWFLARAVAARDPQGRIIRWIGTNTDVHDQKLIADQLAELNATLAQRVEEKTRERDRIWNVSQDLLLVAERNGVWRTLNPAWTRTLGWSEAELLNRTSEWLEHPDDDGITRARFRSSAPAKPRSGSRAAFATRTAPIAGCRGPGCPTRITSMRLPAT